MSRFVRLAAAFAVAALAWTGRPIGPHAFDARAATVAFEDRSGAALAIVQANETERRVPVPLAAISPRFLAAVVATEDRRFFAHDGIDALAIARAALQLAHSRRAVSGASTLTMQLARLRFGLPRTPLGKLEELLMARRIEAGCSKAAILEAYANEVPMGGELVGVEAASRAYFGVPARDLDLAQAAFLAALPNDPVQLDPYEHRDALEARRRFVLARMEQAGFASAEAVRRAAAERVAVLPPRDGIVAAPHLLLRLAKRASQQGGRVRTTLDRELQGFVENAVAQVVQGLASRGARDGAALVVDNRDGAIVAYAGSAGYFTRRGAGKNDGVVALRQPGSTLKPFLYELGLERRAVRPTSILADVPAAYALPGNRSYAPSDYSTTFAGPVRMRIALADSLNVPAVRILATVGVPAFLDRLHALGFRHLTQSADYYGLGLALGDGEVTLEELAAAYATIARGGRAVHVHAFPDDDATSVPNAPSGDDNADAARVGRPEEWALVTDVLADAHARARAFGVASLLRTPFPSAVKTGTSSDFHDTWTVGFTRDYTVATWVGNFDGSPLRRVSGVAGAAPLWNRIIRRLAQSSQPLPFTPPSAIASAAGYSRREMCATSGLRPTVSCPAVVGEWLDAQDVRQWSSTARRPLPRLYDAWLAAQPATAHVDDASGPEPLRIVAPHYGDVYVDAPGAAIRVVARGTRHPRWTLNGHPLRTAASSWTLPLHRGRWTLRAHDDAHADTVTFTVGDAPPRSKHLGFTL